MSAVKKGISGKFLLLCLTFVGLVLVGFLITKNLIGFKENDEKVIGLVTEQLLFSQSYVKNFYYFMETKDPKNVTEVVKSFELNNQILNRIEIEDSETMQKYKVVYESRPDKISTDQLRVIGEKWEDLKKTAISLLGVSIEEKTKAYAEVLAAGDRLDNSIRKLKSHLESKSSQNFTVIEASLVAILGLSILVVILSLYLLKKKAITPLTEKFQRVDTSSNSFSEEISRILVRSNEIETGVQDLSGSLQSAMSSITEISQMTKKTSDLTDSSAQRAKNCHKNSLKGKDTVTYLEKSLSEIQNSNKELVNEISRGNGEINSILDEIKKIEAQTQVINDIVFQTKLLSFNASVEAARAGEGGKGFAVVAEEVGNLARMSGESALKISSLLNQTTKNVGSIIEKNQERVGSSVGTSKQKIEEGLKWGKACSEIFVEINESISSVQSESQQVSTATKEQYQGVMQIEKSMLAIEKENANFKSAVANILESGKSLKDLFSEMGTSLSFFKDILFGEPSKQKGSKPPKKVKSTLSFGSRFWKSKESRSEKTLKAS